MQVNCYLSIDIGASSGRHIIGYLQNGIFKTEEIYRFPNRLIQKDGFLCWELDRLFDEILNGLMACKAKDIRPVSLGIDTWGVDFVLLDSNLNVIGNTVGYRDARTTGIDKEVFDIIPEAELYSRTGIQNQPFNTIYQLYAIKQSHPELLEKAEHFLMIPDYFNFLLTGKLTNEYTNASTSQLINAKTKTWDFELIEMLGLPKRIFKDLQLPKASVGTLLSKIAERVGFQTEVVLPATHDTGSAVVAAPINTDSNSVYISSGTWSLIGIERTAPDCSEQSRKSNFTNEGGVDYRFRYLKNVMGLWMIQSVKKELEEEYTFAQLCELAKSEDSFPSRVDVLDNSFLAPESMIDAIKDYCKATNQQIPCNTGQLAACIYKSLAECYNEIVNELETITGEKYDIINIVGGGCNAEYLNKLTATATGKIVLAGPSEATAIGNIAVQMLRNGEFDSLDEVRKTILNSFDIKQYKFNEKRV